MRLCNVIYNYGIDEHYFIITPYDSTNSVVIVVYSNEILKSLNTV